MQQIVMFNLLQICRPINEIFTQSLKKRVYGRCPVSNFKQASCAATFLDNCARQTASLPQGNGSAGAGIGASQSRERPRAWHNLSQHGYTYLCFFLFIHHQLIKIATIVKKPNPNKSSRLDQTQISKTRGYFAAFFSRLYAIYYCHQKEEKRAGNSGIFFRAQAFDGTLRKDRHCSAENETAKNEQGKEERRGQASFLQKFCDMRLQFSQIVLQIPSKSSSEVHWHIILG